MENSDSKKNKKPRKVPKKSLSKTSSEHKENVPKNEKPTVRSDPDDGIAKSKLLLMKKNKTRARRQSKHERICPNDADPEEEEPKRKKAKKSRIKNYSKSTFNALSEEISKKLTENESNYNVSDCSSDSNKTIEYDATPYTLYQPVRPRPFSPLPSTSKDRETFIKNDELFNESLKGIDAMEHPSPLKEKATENNNVKVEKLEESTPAQQSPQNENEVEIIDVPYDTIVIDENSDSLPQKRIKNELEESDLIEIIEPDTIAVPKPKQTLSNLTNDDDCIIITNETVNEDSKETILLLKMITAISMNHSHLMMTNNMMML